MHTIISSISVITVISGIIIAVGISSITIVITIYLGFVTAVRFYFWPTTFLGLKAFVVVVVVHPIRWTCLLQSIYDTLYFILSDHPTLIEKRRKPKHGVIQ
jgi:hypothetical protein